MTGQWSMGQWIVGAMNIHGLYGPKHNATEKRRHTCTRKAESAIWSNLPALLHIARLLLVHPNATMSSQAQDLSIRRRRGVRLALVTSQVLPIPLLG